MATLRCPQCKGTTTLLPDNYRGTQQCSACGIILWFVTQGGHVTEARPRKLNLTIPADLPADLEKILSEAIACAEVGSNAAAVILAGLFMEGLLSNASFDGRGLHAQIQKANNANALTKLSFSLAEATRLLRNMGAHYSPDLAQLSESDAQLALAMATKLVSDLRARLKPTK